MGNYYEMVIYAPKTDISDLYWEVKVNEKTISDNLYTVGIPDPDLVIRTSGELRTSNFLPWQIVYSEFYFTKVYWPDFHEKELDEAIEEFKNRKRNFGGTAKK